MVDVEPKAQRRCLVCRNRAGKASLLRFVISPEGGLLFDARQRAQGRGLHVCAQRECVERGLVGAFRRGARQRELQLPAVRGFVDTVVLPALWRLYREALSTGRASGELLTGADSVERESRDGRLGAYLLATDASEGTRGKVESNADRKRIPVLGLMPRAALADATGRDNPVVCGWRAGRQCARFMDIEAQLVALGVSRAPLATEATGAVAHSGKLGEQDGNQAGDWEPTDDDSAGPKTRGVL